MSIKRYGQTDHESEASESFQCREIVKEVLRFGVSQKQIVTIIKLLALELDDRDLMLKITDSILGTAESASNQTKIIT